MAPGLSPFHENFEKLEYLCIYTLHIHMFYTLGTLKWYNNFRDSLKISYSKVGILGKFSKLRWTIYKFLLEHKEYI
jgi:hypothetical protein